MARTKHEIIEVTFSVKAVVEVPRETDVDEAIEKAAKTANMIVKDSLFAFDAEDVSDIIKIK